MVDDEPDLLILLERVLRRHGFAVITALTFDAALAVLAAQRVSAVVADLHLPGAGSEALLDVVERWYPGTGFLLFSGDPNVEQHAKALGVPWLQKGAHNVSELVRALRRIVGLAE